MTGDPCQPKAWANLLVKAWGPRFPVDVEQIATEYSSRYTDPIKAIKSASGSGFEGALYPLPKINQWAILYNPEIASAGRKKFTIAHEFGHYLIHRKRFPNGIECGEANLLGYDANSIRQAVEQEADTFASYLLMPMDDFRDQIKNEHVNLDLLQHCADRYQVSFTAAALKWLDFTNQCAMLVVATNGFILWCRRSSEARRRRIYFDKGMRLPPASCAANPGLPQTSQGRVLDSNVWPAPSSSREMVIFADKYEMTISLLVFEHQEERNYPRIRSFNRGI